MAILYWQRGITWGKDQSGRDFRPRPGKRQRRRLQNEQI